MIKLIIFDAYGVVITGGYPFTAQKVAKRFKINEQKAYKIIYGFFNQAAERKISQKFAWEKAVQALNLPITGEELKQIHYSTFGLNRSILPMIKNWQKQEIKTLLLSKNTRPQFKDINDTFPELRKTFGKNIINTWELRLPKASKATMLYLFKRYKVKGNEVVMIDDQLQNLIEAKKLGVKSLVYKGLRELKKKNFI